MASPPNPAHPQPGDLMRLSAPDDEIGNTVLVSGRQGNYVLLENGHRFHVLDDRIRDRFWMTHIASYYLPKPEPQIP